MAGSVPPPSQAIATAAGPSHALQEAIERLKIAPSSTMKPDPNFVSEPLGTPISNFPLPRELR